MKAVGRSAFTLWCCSGELRFESTTASERLVKCKDEICRVTKANDQLMKENSTLLDHRKKCQCENGN